MLVLSSEGKVQLIDSDVNHNYDKILKSDWLSTLALAFALVEQWTLKKAKRKTIKGAAAFVYVLKCAHNREIKKTGIDQVLVPLTHNELLIAEMLYISSQNSYLFISVNVAPFSTFNAFNITNLKKEGQSHKIMKMKI